MLDRTDRFGPARRLTAAAAILVAGPTIAIAGEGEDLSTPCPRWAVDTVYWSPSSSTCNALLVRDVNVHGVIVGDETCVSTSKAFMWTKEDGVQYLPFPDGSRSSRVFGITDDGLIAGTVGLESALRGWVYDGETMTIIDPIPGAFQSVEVTGITSDGTVTGETATVNPEVPVAPFRWKDGVLTTIEDRIFSDSVNTFGVTDDGVIHGHYWDSDHEPSRWQAFLLDGETVHSLPLPADATYSDVRGRKSDGSWWGLINRPDESGANQALPIFWGEEGTDLVDPFPYHRLYFDNAVADGVYSGRAIPYGSNHTTRVIWDHGVIRLLDDVVEHPDYNGSFLRVDHAREGTLFLIGYGPPDVEFASMIAHPSPPVPGDLDCDGLVQFHDVLILLSAWNGTYGQRADLDGDGQIGLGDLQALLKLWN